MRKANMFRKYIIICLVLMTICLCAGAKINCKCWKDFEVTSNAFGNIYCQDKKLRTFGCNEEEPPKCECTHKGLKVVIDLGESNCQSVDPSSGSWCNNRQDWVNYFMKHPEYLMLD
ncbi:hypothetical protein WA026_002953 [Henosepilachna vigintioctopunctata]|uniref:Uncharacterized protein n=1 Tax=Henosepilachna vigintioctopunctata TaxID=420089 RepID=A0AAW1TL49_9CUCU